MNNATSTEPVIVSKRTTFDGATVYLHADGAVSTRTYILRGKLPIAQMWRVWDDIGLYTAAELDGLLRSVRKGTYVPFRIRPSVNHEAILAGQLRRHVCVRNGVIMPVNGAR